MTTYYTCTGVVSIVGTGNNQGLKCSTGWTQAVEPVYTLISQQQAESLISAILSVIAIYVIFRLLYKTLR